ncbi:MAG TPA: hypothetical protein VNC39_03315 [Acidocella sp.]|jgi:hypothetical protein|nr:hypothetical protein [Acidocella sp.]HVE20978.1 hypothetical protein [Acidocella sp.]
MGIPKDIGVSMELIERKWPLFKKSGAKNFWLRWAGGSETSTAQS